ncbi:acetyl esterase/lipase [Haloactinospora alba]|uniref:Acetyl esterase/lipase n=1 Tax=Haloactinospora alba TaxID=405555 RepID=A0A543NI24_9ACTN|nr:alpha/beta hydrolase [Haloactinospora alba]TQN31498.1 acetyl esterase/lipase [Haloactinospora alba]
MRTETLSYGSSPDQVVHTCYPESIPVHRPAPVAVLLHGGWWRDRHDLHLMDPLAEGLVQQGWVVWNVEYRRTGKGGGGWPQTLEDVRRALNLLRWRIGRSTEAGHPSGVVAIGHSAGGHLGLLAAPGSPLTGVVALAPVTDLVTSARDGLGEDAVADFLGPAAGETVAEEASPLYRLPLGVTQLVLHGTADQRVPVEQSRSYVEAAHRAGDPVTYREASGADHFAVIDPEDEAWRVASSWLSERAYG